jgi:hypothetical protein
MNEYEKLLGNYEGVNQIEEGLKLRPYETMILYKKEL